MDRVRLKKIMREGDREVRRRWRKRVMDRERVRGNEGGRERLNRREEKGETPLRGSTVTPAGRFTPSTK